MSTGRRDFGTSARSSFRPPAGLFPDIAQTPEVVEKPVSGFRLGGARVGRDPFHGPPGQKPGVEGLLENPSLHVPAEGEVEEVEDRRRDIHDARVREPDPAPDPGPASQHDALDAMHAGLPGLVHDGRYRKAGSAYQKDVIGSEARVDPNV